MSTGEIEVEATNIEIFSKSTLQLPLQIRPQKTAKESIRMEHRYLDFRTPLLQRNLRARSELSMRIREFMVRSRFLDISKPII
jgi:aspartyl-tRNA synthetase